MRRLNRAASQALVASGVRTATDVTGFGLLGHGLEMARASGTRFVFEAAGLPALPGALDLAAAGVETGGAAHNRRYVAGSLDVAAGVPSERITLAHDPQTSGGLLAAVPPDLVARRRARAWTTPASSAGGSAVSRPVNRGSRWRPETWNGPPDDGRTGRRCVPRSGVQSTTIPNGAAPPGIANGEPSSSVERRPIDREGADLRDARVDDVQVVAVGRDLGIERPQAGRAREAPSSRRGSGVPSAATA